MEKIQFIQTTPEQLEIKISKGIKVYLDEFLKNFKPKQANDYLTRKEVAEMFQIDISSVHNWSKSGKLKPLAIGSRIYYLRSDIEKSLTPLNS